MKKINLMITWLLLGGVVLAAPTVIWEENFERFNAGDKPGLYHAGKGLVLSEGPLKFYRFPGGFMGGFDYFGAKHWKDYDLKFKLRPQGNFTLYLITKSGGWRGDTPYMWYYLPITLTAISPYAHQLPASVTNTIPAAAINPPLATNVWYTFAVGVTASNITIRAQGPGEAEARLLWDHAVLPGGGGIDFHGTPPFDLADIVVTEP